MSKDFTIYDTYTGEILRSGACPEQDFARQCRSGETIVNGRFTDTKIYFLNGEPVARPKFPEPIIGTSSVVFDGVPHHTTIRVDDNLYSSGEEELVELVFDDPGVYKISLTKFPYQPYDSEIEIAD